MILLSYIEQGIYNLRFFSLKMKCRYFKELDNCSTTNLVLLLLERVFEEANMLFFLVIEEEHWIGRVCFIIGEKKI